ncbi:hypothetical protein ACFWMR_10390 [Amycolatopsis thailandensis]|uniref:hypothetical protein n=1 Tax=Amycolatopsis thailandensis TaxID=589330 RepID=UPI0036631A42
MFKPSRIATVLLAATGAVLAGASSASADDHNTQQFTEGGIQAANNFNHATCICPVPLTGGQEIAVVPALAHYNGAPTRNLANVSGDQVDALLVEHE